MARICGIYLPPEYSDKPHWIYAETMSIAEGMALYMDLKADTTYYLGIQTVGKDSIGT